MACWRCPKCGQLICDLPYCPYCGYEEKGEEDESDRN